jgi:hypothetical protein
LLDIIIGQILQRKVTGSASYYQNYIRKSDLRCKQGYSIGHFLRLQRVNQ